MARRVISAITRALREEWTEPDVHFHSGTAGRPYVCSDSRCTSPHLDTR